jgi:uncharacterized lipoprotein YddW (UPF0748 family)
MLASSPYLTPARGLTKRYREGLVFFATFFIASVLTKTYCNAASYQPSRVSPPTVTREFRGAWVASVGNISWPSTSSLTSAEQRAELISLLDKAAKLGLNAVLFQVRPSCDALYPSKLEPWSEYLTGQMGKAPSPFYDPLEFAIKEAHARGLELHAWFNPYRARHTSAKSPISLNHISKRQPQLVKKYGSSLWLDPGEKEVQDYSIAVVLDVVKRYDIDGVHFDDYFYPYPEKDASGKPLDFPDGSSWKRFGVGGKLSREDWRRENINSFVQRAYREIKAAKPWVKFGISPFGIWRPGNPAEVRGKDAYAELYADSRKWLANGWMDYCAPQLYWQVDAPQQSFPALLDWWLQQNGKNRHVWPGLNTSNTARNWPVGEIDRQIRLTRERQGADGHVHWDLRKGICENPALYRLLDEKTYARPALTPAFPWLAQEKPGKPTLGLRTAGKTTATWRSSAGARTFLWVMQSRTGGEWKTEICPSSHTSRTWSSAPDVVAITAVDRLGQTSPAAVLELKD